MDDHEIVDLYWQRDEHAIEATAAKYESYCMKISQNILSDRADSEENVNDTYLHAWQAMPPQRPAILSAFLGKIARNLALNRYKARSAQKRQGDAFALSLDELDDCAPRPVLARRRGHGSRARPQHQRVSAHAERRGAQHVHPALLLLRTGRSAGRALSLRREPHQNHAPAHAQKAQGASHQGGIL